MGRIFLRSLRILPVQDSGELGACSVSGFPEIYLNEAASISLSLEMRQKKKPKKFTVSCELFPLTGYKPHLTYVPYCGGCAYGGGYSERYVIKLRFWRLLARLIGKNEFIFHQRWRQTINAGGSDSSQAPTWVVLQFSYFWSIHHPVKFPYRSPVPHALWP